MNVSGWRAALRIARREAWRAKGRSLLIVLMVALPVFAASAAAVTYRSQQLSVDERLERRIGQADALVWSLREAGGLAVAQDPADGGKSQLVPDNPSGAVEFVPTPPTQPTADTHQTDRPPMPDAGATIPPGSTVLTETDATVSIRTKYGLASTDFVELDYASPVAKGILRQTSGRAPRTTDEVVVTDALLSAGGLKVGGTITEYGSGKVFTVVGTVRVPDTFDARRVFAPPGALLDGLARAVGLELQRKYLVDAPPGAYRWDAVRALNEKGIVATSREAAHQDLPDSAVPYRSLDTGSADALGDLALAVMVVVIGMALLEVVLLAGPAFAVGARRRKRDLGLVGVVGGDRRHIRTIVLADGVVLGTVAGALGTALGLAAAWFSRDWFSETTGKQIGAYDVRPLELLGIAVLGLVVGVIAAAVPAFLAARESVVDSLTGRRGVRHGSRILPLVGAGMGAVGLGLAYYGARVSPSDAVTLAGCVIAELGLIACCPALLGVAGRLGRLLPLTPRLALRDAARNRPRSAPAVAAIMA
ncbi:MAG: ABC transporter permease, partial [Streptomycetaceae bacterium]|nr:ABC transporter permease [Streptomycetaceae bacterium]